MRKSEYIKTVVRLRPSILRDSTGPTGPCAEILEGPTVRVPEVELEANTHVVDFAVKDSESNSVLWEQFGNELMPCFLEKKRHCCVCIWGVTRSGKTHVFRGIDESKKDSDTPYFGESILGRSLEEVILADPEALLSMYLLHDDYTYDLATNVDNMKVKFEDGCVSVSGCGSQVMGSSQAVEDFCKKCFNNRKDFMRKSDDMPQLTATVIHITGSGGGSLTIIECPAADAQHIPPKAMTPAQQKFNKTKNKQLTAFNQAWIQSATEGEPKALGWRDSWMGKWMQPGLSAAMGNEGMAIMVVCVPNVLAFKYAAAASFQFAESCTKQESLKTVGEYKEVLIDIEERLESRRKNVAPLKAAAANEEKDALAVYAKNETKIKELDFAIREIDMKLSAAQEVENKAQDKIRAGFEKEKSDLLVQMEKELDRIKNLAKNGPSQAAEEIKKLVQSIEAEQKSEVDKGMSEVQVIQNSIKKYNDLLAGEKRVKLNRQKEEVESFVPIREKEKEIQKAQAALGLAGKSREDGLTDQEVLENLPLWESRDAVDDLERDVFDLAHELLAIEAGVDKGVGRPKLPGEESSSSEEESDASSDISETASEMQERLEAERIKKEEEEAARLEAEEEDKFQHEWWHFRDCVVKDFVLAEVLEKYGPYLSYGLPITVLDSKTGAYTRQFMFFMKGNKGIAFTKLPGNSNQPPDRRHPIRVVLFDKCDAIHLGQHSPLFQHEIKRIGARTDTYRMDEPPPIANLHLTNLHKYYYRSISLQYNVRSFVDMVAESRLDFEGIVNHIHRNCNLPLGWGKKLFVEVSDRCEELDIVEKTICEELHMLPVDYLRLKNDLLLNYRRHYVTLYDLRNISGLDVYHCQRLMEVFVKKGWISRRQMCYYRSQELAKLPKSEWTPPQDRPAFVPDLEHIIEQNVVDVNGNVVGLSQFTMKIAKRKEDETVELQDEDDEIVPPVEMPSENAESSIREKLNARAVAEAKKGDGSDSNSSGSSDEDGSSGSDDDSSSGSGGSSSSGSSSDDSSSGSGSSGSGSSDDSSGSGSEDSSSGGSSGSNSSSSD